MNRLRRLLADVRASLAYRRALLATPVEKRFTRLRWWLLPWCWLCGHRWTSASGAFNSWTAYPCRCCGQEIGGWVSVDQIPFRPDDADDFDPWGDE
jgi:hypothetical protein